MILNESINHFYQSFGSYLSLHKEEFTFTSFGMS